jgi:hypothetical protein
VNAVIKLKIIIYKLVVLSFHSLLDTVLIFTHEGNSRCKKSKDLF